MEVSKGDCLIPPYLFFTFNMILIIFLRPFSFTISRKYFGTQEKNIYLCLQKIFAE